MTVGNTLCRLGPSPAVQVCRLGSIFGDFDRVDLGKKPRLDCLTSRLPHGETCAGVKSDGQYFNFGDRDATPLHPPHVVELL
jgi:hypothetical protein